MRIIEEHVFEPEYAISNNLVELSRKELCALVAEIARQIKADSGKAYHGGVYPENISRNPKGDIAFGPIRKSEWSEQELNYIAPEIYWNNRSAPQSDVYALGLILYYGASAGKLPFEGEAGNAQLMRMSGKTVYAPAAAGKQLGDIIEKALRFKEAERYRTPEELAIMLDYCEDNRLLGEKSGAEAIFQKEEAELSDLEHIMLKIIEGEADVDLAKEQNGSEDGILDDIMASVREGAPEEPLTEDEVFLASGLRRPEPAARQPEEESSLRDIFGLDEPDPRDPAELEKEEEIRVYEPGSGKKEGIPILTEEPEPELKPITVKNNSNRKKNAGNNPGKNAAKTSGSNAGRANGSGSGQKSGSSEQDEPKKRPFLVVLMLLAVLLIAAVVARILINAFSDQPPSGQSANVAVSSTSDSGSADWTQQVQADTDVSAILSEEQIQAQQEQEALAQQQAAEEAGQAQQPEADPAALPHSYEAVRADVSWMEAQAEAQARGGYLVTINSQEEFDQVVALVQEAGFDRVWIGAHRVDNNLVWESGEDVTFYFWDQGEPSFTDGGDGAAEDFLMLWDHGGVWCYNDSRENPLEDFYGMYGGRIGYVVEKVG